MTTNHTPTATLTNAGYFHESFLQCWMKHENGYIVTISDGVGCNGQEFEVQITTDDGEFIDGSEGDQTQESAVEFARVALAKSKGAA